jgi:nucleotide-binding universal stress UspA family protein
MYLHYDYIVGIRDWFRKKIKRPVTDSIESVSKTGYKKEKPEQKLAEEHTMTSRQDAPETTTTVEVEQREMVQLNPTDNELQTLDKIHKSEATTKPTSLQRLSPEAIPKYSKILVPHDGSEISDKALAHAIYQSKISGAEIVILNVVEYIESKESSTMTATMKGEGGKKFDKTRRADLDITVEGEVKQMTEEKIRLCKEAGVTTQISYKIQTGKPVEEIVKLAEEMNIDLIVMASSRIISPVMVHVSVTRKVMDGTKKPVLVIC